MKNAIKGFVAAAIVLGTAAPMAFAATTPAYTNVGTVAFTFNGTTVANPYILDSQDSGNTTAFAPVFYFDELLSKAGVTASWNGSTHTWALTDSSLTADQVSTIASSVAGGLGTGNTTITLNGTPIKKINTFAAQDPAAKNQTTYFPAYYVNNIFAAMNINATWNGTTGLTVSTAATSFTAKQTGADTVEADFNGAVASGTTVTLSDASGDNYTVTPTWNSANTSVTLNTGYNLPAGTYTITAGKLTGTVTIAEATPTKISISTAGLAAIDGAPVNFTVQDQFGNTISDYNALNIVAYDANNGEQFTPATQTSTSATFNLETGDKSPVAVGDKIVVSVTDPTTGASATATLPVVGTTNISSLQLGAASDNGSSTVQSGDTGVSLAYTATGVDSSSVTLPQGSGATIGGIEFLSSNPDVVNASSFAVDASGNLTFTAGAAGSTIITAVNLNTGTSSTATINVTDSTAVQSFHVSGPSTLLVAGGTADLPYTAVDGTGAQIPQANFTSGDQTQVKWLSSDDSIVNPDTDISYDSSNNLVVSPEKSGSVTLTATINGVVQNSVTLNVQPAAYPVSITGVTSENPYVETGSNSQTLSASNLTIVNQYGQAYTPANTDTITIVPTSGEGNVTVSATSDADGTQPTNGAKVYGDGSVTFTGAQAGATVFQVTVSNGTQQAQYNLTLSDVDSTGVTSYSLDAASTLYDGANGFPSASPSLTISNYDMPVAVYGKTANGQLVTLASSPVAYITSSDTSVVGVKGTNIEGIAQGSATVTAYDSTGKELASGTINVSSAFPIVKSVSWDTDTIDESSAATSTDITSDILSHLSVTDQYGADYPVNGYFVSSDPSIITGGTTVKTTTATSGSVTLTYVAANGTSASVTVTR